MMLKSLISLKIVLQVKKKNEFLAQTQDIADNMQFTEDELNSDFRICPTCSSKSLKTENGCDSCMACGYSKCDK